VDGDFGAKSKPEEVAMKKTALLVAASLALACSAHSAPALDTSAIENATVEGHLQQRGERLQNLKAEK
jgi:hypothetical protein